MVVTSQYSQRQQVRKYLEQHLRPLRNGAPLPPMRTLMSQAGVSQGKLEVVLKELQKEGLIERRPRKGIFKASQAENAQNNFCIELVVCESFPINNDPQEHHFQVKSLYSGALIEALTRSAGQRHRPIRVHVLPHDAPLSVYEQLAQQSDVKAAILLWVHSPEIPQIFTRAQVDWVSLTPRMGPHGARCIINSEDIMQIQLDYLWKLGHRRIGYIYSGPTSYFNYVINQRRESYYKLMAENGHVIQPHWVAEANYKETKIAQAMQQIFSQKPYPTAVIMTDPHLPTAYRFVQERGMIIGKDISLMGTDDVAIASLLHPKATSVHNSPELAVEMATKGLETIMAGGDIPDLQTVPLKLRVRESTGPAPTD